MDLDEVVHLQLPIIKETLEYTYNKGYDEGYKDASGKVWHFTADGDYPPQEEEVFCYGQLKTTYGGKVISDKSFIGYYKGSYGWFIKNAVDGESDQSWPVEAWRELDTPPRRVK